MQPESGGRLGTRCTTLIKFFSIIFLTGVATLAASVAPVPGQAADSWALTGSLNTTDMGSRTALLPNGKVLLVKGYASGQAIVSCELYDPTSGTWTPTGSLNTAFYPSTATLLPDGKVLIAGGNVSGQATDSCELYDPILGIWQPTGPLVNRRQGHTATLLANGKVLIAGGYRDKTSHSILSCELYDPILGIWLPTGNLNQGKLLHTATLLLNGQVLLADGPLSRSCELYDPGTGTWSLAINLVSPSDGKAILLPNGKVLCSGMSGDWQLYDPNTGTWTLTGHLATWRRFYTATLLANGKVLVAGGDHNRAITSCEFYDPVTETWTPAPSLNIARSSHTATLLSNGKVLVVGGKDANDNPQKTCEVYGPGPYHNVTTEAGGGGTISPGTVTVEEGRDLTFLINPDTGYRVTDVLVDGGSVGAVTSYTFINITADHTISASFAIYTFAITATAGPGGTIIPAAAIVPYGGSQTFSIIPNLGYHVADVLVNGYSVGGKSSYTFSNVTADHTISASFAIDTFSILTSTGPGGTISPPAATVPYGGSQTFNIIPNTGYRVADVLVDGVSVGPMTSYTFTNVTTGHTLSASFTSQPIEIIANQRSINVWPGRISTLLVRLGENPTGNVTVAVTKSGNPAIIIQGGASLTFNAANWHVNQPVQLTVSGASHDPSLPATILFSGTGLASTTVEARIDKGKGPYNSGAMLLLLE